MCGILGVLGKYDKLTVRKMLTVIDHRGPDDEGYYFDSSIALGHKRLSIIDLKTGKQPIFSADGKKLIVFNGEIYNYLEIRAELEKLGRKFSTKSDTEVILQAYEEWGPQSVKRLNGMFAFAIWDKSRKELFLARDRVGIKPVYYHRTKNAFYFASEMKAIIADPAVKKALNPHALIDYLTFQNNIDDNTFFSGIMKLRPGHYMMVAGPKVETVCYWEPDFSKENIDDKRAVREYKDVVKDSVKRHMISDVPLGCYLSGGFDSGIVTAVAGTLSKKPVQTFTGSFPEGGWYSELAAARAVAKKSKAKGHEVVVTHNDFMPSMPSIVYHLDEPSTGCVCFPAYHVSKLVSKNVKVVLTGHGGDELFAGYQAFKGVYFREMLKKQPWQVFSILDGLRPGELTRILYYMLGPIFRPEVKHGLFIMSSKKELSKMLTHDFYSSLKDYDPMKTIKDMTEGLSDIEAIEKLYVKTYLPALFEIEDKVGMANSIEARTPLCDNELIEFALKIPIETKLTDNTLKFIPKESMKGLLPGILYNQPKRGFPTPLVPWFRGPLKDHLYDVLCGERVRKRGVFNVDYLRKMLDRFNRRRTDTLYDYAIANKLFSLYSIELWFRIFMDGDVKKPGKDFF